MIIHHVEGYPIRFPYDSEFRTRIYLQGRYYTQHNVHNVT